ncbi:MAG: hypothetical protein HYY20_03570 [Candidatus Tectomicrobia bacterium]|uniref:Type 4 fimbrial biogenesis protein PilX N-terminal domain-containing protein n=1 Tax=Tectimicrobiota bacterium TaxID=2528274 RepID=A0A932FVZ4_UNCTE|nr:hypothetical protein [Candidatus Tectomicrobia bacterium]
MRWNALLRPSNRHGPERDERGFVLIFSLVFTFLLALVALNFHGLGSTEADLVQRQVTHSQAFQLAEAGIERALYQLRLDPTWRGADPPNGVAFASHDRSLGGGTYNVLLYDSTNDGRGLYDASLSPAEVRLSSTGTTGPTGASISRSVGAHAEIKSDFTDPEDEEHFLPGPIYVPGELNQVDLEDNFRIDGHDTDPQTGARETDSSCTLRHGITSLAGVGGILNELRSEGTEAQVEGVGSSPSVSRIAQGVDIDQLVTEILNAAQGQGFYQTFQEKKIQTDTAWGSYPNDLRVVRVENKLRVKEQTLSGAGILIVEKELKVDAGATFNWTGLVIITKAAGELKLEHAGRGTLYGALLIGGSDGRGTLELESEETGGPRFLYSCDALDAIAAAFPSFGSFRQITLRSWSEVSTGAN